MNLKVKNIFDIMVPMKAILAISAFLVAVQIVHSAGSGGSDTGRVRIQETSDDEDLERQPKERVDLKKLSNSAYENGKKLMEDDALMATLVFLGRNGFDIIKDNTASRAIIEILDIIKQTMKEKNTLRTVRYLSPYIKRFLNGRHAIERTNRHMEIFTKYATDPLSAERCNERTAAMLKAVNDPNTVRNVNQLEKAVIPLANNPETIMKIQNGFGSFRTLLLMPNLSSWSNPLGKVKELAQKTSSYISSG